MPLYSHESDIIVGRYTQQQRINGGRVRASTASRDRWGRMLPKSGTLPEPQAHGVKAGQIRAATAKREKGRFIK